VQKAHCLRVITQVRDMEICAEYSAATGRIRLLQNGAVLREWFPPNSWTAIASVSGAGTWGTCPGFDELRALLENHVSTLPTGDVSSVV
jgi:hypothetical protein